MQLLTAALYLLRDIVFCAALTVFSRHALLFPRKDRPIAVAVTALLIGINAAVCVYGMASDPEDARMAGDLFSFALVVAGAASGLQSPLRGLPAVLFTALVADFTADTVYSLFSFAAADALWFESLFLLCIYALLLAGLLALRRKNGLSALAGALRTVPKWFWFTLLFFEFTCYYREFGEAQSWYLWFYRVAVLLILFCLFWAVYKLVSFSKSRQEILSRLSAAERYGEELLHGDDALRSFRHDYKNHLIVIDAYLENGDAASAAAYLKNIGVPASGTVRADSSGNFAADALLGVKRAEASALGIGLSFRGAIPAEGFRQEDLCTVLSNLLDNAIEACEKCPTPANVLVEGRQTEGFLLLCVTNPLPADTTAELSTSKENKRDHGIGLQNVKRTLRRYGGAITVERENGLFIASARMKLNDD